MRDYYRERRTPEFKAKERERQRVREAAKPLEERRAYRRAIIKRWRSLGTNNQKMLDRARALRLAAITHYGGRCECCGETRFEFLAIDHRNGGGSEHRRREVKGPIERWLKRHGYPEGFRVLCHNCNGAIGYYGVCPHATQPTVT